MQNSTYTPLDECFVFKLIFATMGRVQTLRTLRMLRMLRMLSMPRMLRMLRMLIMQTDESMEISGL